MILNVGKIQFYSGYPIDKIFTTDKSLTLSVPAAVDDSTPGVTIASIPNPYGHAGLTTVSFSIDNNNFYEQNSSIEYWNTTFLETLSQMTVTSACNDSSIFFMATSFYTLGAQTVFINYAVDSIT
jgi:hypothetical protein